MQIREIVKEGYFYLAGLPGVVEAFEAAVGPNVEVWYRRKYERLEDGTILEENWFLTPASVTSSKATVQGIEFNSFSRLKIFSVEQSYVFNRTFIGNELEPQQVTVILENGKSHDIPLPDKNLFDQYRAPYQRFISQLLPP